MVGHKNPQNPETLKKLFQGLWVFRVSAPDHLSF